MKFALHGKMELNLLAVNLLYRKISLFRYFIGILSVFVNKLNLQKLWTHSSEIKKVAV